MSHALHYTLKLQNSCYHTFLLPVTITMLGMAPFMSTGCTSYPQTCIKHFFTKEQSTAHLIAGLFNGIWTDMFIETTWMRHGHGPNGVGGIVMNDKQMKIWCLSEAAVSAVRSQINQLSSGDSGKVQMTHKEEAPSRILSDSKDRKALRDTLELCISPLISDDHTNGPLINIVTGQVAQPDCNLDQAKELGEKQLQEFRASWPSGFYKTLYKPVKGFDLTKRQSDLVTTKYAIRI